MNLDPETTLSRAGRNATTSTPDDSGSPLTGLPDVNAPNSRPAPSDGDDTTREHLEETLAELDGGAGAVACSTGAAAISTVASLFDAGSHLICARDCTSDTERVFSQLAGEGSLSVSYVTLTDRATLTDAVRSSTRALWVESPSNALRRAVDLESLAQFAEAHDLLLIVDNTSLSPLLQRPLDHGADLVVYSSTASLSGHADVTGGAVVTRTETRAQMLTASAQKQDVVATAFDSWLVLRGAKTLPVRLQRQETNARSVAYFLNEHPAVDRVYYPGLRNHPGHENARDQQDGYGGMISFVVDRVQVEVELLVRSTEVFTAAESLGGIESLIDHPATMSQANRQHDANIPDGLIRLSVGIESTDDLTADLEQALDAARTAHSRTNTARTPVPPRVGV